MKIFSIFVDLIVAIIILFVFPIMYFSNAFQTETERHVTQIVENFSDNVETQGRLTKDMYEKLLSDLLATGRIYSIELMSREYVYEPEYDYTGVDEVISNKLNSFIGINNYTYTPVVTAADVVNDPNELLPFVQTVTNELVLADSVDTNAFKEHIHNSSCYANDGSLVCNQIVVSMESTHPIQLLPVGGTPITTVWITFLDGSSKTIALPTDFSTTNEVENAVMNLEYTGLIDANTPNIFIDTCDVCVKNPIKTCPHGHTYYITKDGIDEGCCYCSSEVQSLAIYCENNPIVIEKGATLKENGVCLLVTYMDGTIEYTYDYVDNLDKTYVGTQTVTLGYKGMITTVEVTTHAHMKKCSRCQKVYELYPDDSDPGCPFCSSNIGTFTGNVMEYVEEDYTEEILDAVYGLDECYKFNIDDYFKITLTYSGNNKVFGFFNADKQLHRIDNGGRIRDIHEIE